MPRILLVDDDIAEISAVKRVLLRAGHQAVLATNSSDALAAIAQEMPVLALISATCESGEGLALARRLRDDSRTVGLPVILLGESADAALSVTLPRPIDPAQLAEEMQAALGAPARDVPKPLGRVRLAALSEGSLAPRPARFDRSAEDAERRAAADALRQRAEELRFAAAARRKAPADGTGPALAPDGFPPRPPGGEAERTGAADDTARIEPEARPDTEDASGEAREEDRKVDAEETLLVDLRAEAERLAAEELFVLAQEEARREAEAQRKKSDEEALRRAKIEEELSQLAEEAGEEERRRAEEERAREEESAAIARAAEEEARRHAEAEAAKRAAEEKARQRVEAEAQIRAREEARRQAEEEARRRVEAATAARAVAEEARRRAETEAAARAAAEEVRWRAQMEALAREEEEARRRAEEEEAGARLAEETARRELAERSAARAAQEEAARRRVKALATERRPRPPEPPLPEPPPPPRSAGPVGIPPDSPGPVVAEELPAPPPELAAGTLAELPMPRLLALAAGARVTGRLDFAGETPRSIYLEGGSVVGATSAAPHERVEEVALRLGLVTREQHRLAGAGTSGLASRRAAMLLLDRGWLKPTELTSLVRRRTEEVVFALFGETRAPFRHAAARVPSDERISLDRAALALAVEGVRRKWLAPRLEALLGGPGSLLAPSPQGPLPAELGLTAGEQRVLGLADGLRTLDEVLAGSPLDALATRQILAALVMVGALSVRFHAGARAAEEAPSIDLARVREKLDQVRRADYFAILGLARHCTPYEIREAAERLAAEFEPLRFAGVPEPGLAEKLSEIRRVVAEAREVLCDDALRGEYLAALGDEVA